MAEQFDHSPRINPQIGDFSKTVASVVDCG